MEMFLLYARCLDLLSRVLDTDILYWYPREILLTFAPGLKSVLTDV